MSNKQYNSGRRFEYEVADDWNERGYNTIRAAGSHGLYDVLAFRLDRKPEFIQAKRVSTQVAAKRLIQRFRTEVVPSVFYHQSISVKVKGDKRIQTFTV